MNRYWLDRSGTSLPEKMTPGLGLPPECGTKDCENRVSTASGPGKEYKFRCDECLLADKGKGDRRRRWSKEDKQKSRKGWPLRKRDRNEYRNNPGTEPGTPGQRSKPETRSVDG